MKRPSGLKTGDPQSRSQPDFPLAPVQWTPCVVVIALVVLISAFAAGCSKTCSRPTDCESDQLCIDSQCVPRALSLPSSSRDGSLSDVAQADDANDGGATPDASDASSSDASDGGATPDASDASSSDASDSGATPDASDGGVLDAAMVNGTGVVRIAQLQGALPGNEATARFFDTGAAVINATDSSFTYGTPAGECVLHRESLRSGTLVPIDAASIYITGISAPGGAVGNATLSRVAPGVFEAADLTRSPLFLSEEIGWGIVAQVGSPPGTLKGTAPDLEIKVPAPGSVLIASPIPGQLINLRALPNFEWTPTDGDAVTIEIGTLDRNSIMLSCVMPPAAGLGLNFTSAAAQFIAAACPGTPCTSPPTAYLEIRRDKRVLQTVERFGASLPVNTSLTVSSGAHYSVVY